MHTWGVLILDGSLVAGCGLREEVVVELDPPIQAARICSYMGWCPGTRPQYSWEHLVVGVEPTLGPRDLSASALFDASVVAVVATGEESKPEVEYRAVHVSRWDYEENVDLVLVSRWGRYLRWRHGRRRSG